jgi:mono/diheme cytochrome c family protein
MQRCSILVCILGIVACLAISGIAQDHARSASSASTESSGANTETSPATHSAAAASSSIPADKDKAAMQGELRVEGEKRFRTNCGRCHMAPHKFPPRVMATAIRHMRVRAMLTDEDMRLILLYMTQ